MSDTTGPVSARERARRAKAKLDADRRGRDKRIEDHTTSWYRCADKLDELRTKYEDAVAECASEQNAAVAALLDQENVAPAEVAALLGITAAQARAARKTHDRATSAESAGTESTRTVVSATSDTGPTSTTHSGDVEDVA